ncbi:survival protein sure-likephosphatase/nucleotidase-like protein [Trematosphaeria pertusa]|uniref:Survival protein sure-likephosphatase/nucleotidase-like protein n=1 Tax=Trematosphaeria pertusa TaxID=390896 RepID=A0A6A6IBF1_9PLEO|nr:survival protein sure-likephosphatase/nucleotidase-like protein [Trematosphaeria pertusa]KAF2247904.1 survival protein sure-likephosphatase/nucleotidase-like protein [Trematosphaeria pertusa]
MRFSLYLSAILPLAQGIRIIQSNDDGWAETNARTFFNRLTAAGHDVVLSGPAENKSGSGSLDAAPTQVDSDGCQFQSCPPKSPPTGANASEPRFNYVNSYPVTAMKTGIDTTGPNLWDGAKPELAVSGPNVGANLGAVVLFSGTVGAAMYAAREAGIPAIAFSGSSGDPTAWNAPTPAYSTVYAELANTITSAVVASGTPYLPTGIWLNVNFPEASSQCSSPDQFKFVLTKITWRIFTQDTEWCGSDSLPLETSVISRTDGCYVTISVGDTDGVLPNADADAQRQVAEKLKPLLSCLPS